MKLSVEPLADGVSITPAQLPALPMERAALLARVRQVVLARAPDADVVVGGRSVLVLGPAPDALAGLALEDDGDRGSIDSGAAAPRRVHTLEVVYDGDDLADVASAAGLTPAAVAALHAERSYVALVTGFMPGFAYLGELAPQLLRPRLATPRRRVPAGALAIAGRFTGVYPFASPGGWNLIGRALDADLFDPRRSPARRIAVLDEVRFVASAQPGRAKSSAAGQPAPPPAPDVDAQPAQLAIVSCAGVATIQDEGRRGQRGEGVPCSGALDAAGLRAANLAAGNAAGAAAIEVIGGAMVVECLQRCWIAEPGAPGRWLSPGERARVDPAPSLVSYLAIQGGVDVPWVLGSRSTLLVAGLGGHHGRVLRAGDRLRVGSAEGDAPDRIGSVDARSLAVVIDDLAQPVQLEITRGLADPRLGDQAFELLCRGTYRVSAALDRVGVRLEGAALPRAGEGDSELPDPMLPGAIQVTTAGTPIVLGPDAAVTGGYPVVGWIGEEGRARLGRLRPGREVVFRERR